MLCDIHVVALLLTSPAPILRDDTERPLSFTARAQLASLCKLTHSDKWQSGKPYLVIVNADLAAMWNVCKRRVQAILADLEQAGFITRHFDGLNRRSLKCGIDLSPLLKQLSYLLEKANAAKQERQAKKQQRCMSETAPPDAENSTQLQKEKYKNNIVTPSNNPQPDEVTTLRCALQKIGISTAKSPDDLINSITKVQQLTFPKLRSQAWHQALKDHGLTATVTALAVAINKTTDRQLTPIQNPTGYLARMLQSSTLKKTVFRQFQACAESV